ncbi:V-type proton ATPase subunit a [Entamoeba marina]
MKKSLYFTLNLFQIDTGHNHLIGEGWFPSEKYQIICDHLDTTPGAAKPIFTVIQKHPNDVPPTYLPTNSFTQCAQSLCETYSIPKYQEINPGFFYIITFPWLFGIMFGDGGHGIIITLFALVMIILQEKIKKTQLNEIFEMLFDSRYMILLMGLFSIYCGMIYNEWFGIQIDLFGTAWDSNDGEYYIHNTKGYVYIFGIDPIWKSSNNELYFYNSFKMKLSMLIGVLHMLFGIWMSLANHIHFKNLLSITFQFLPQIGFMLCSFGYLCFLILIKWVVPIENAPLITTVFLEMFQNFGIVSKENHMYFGQSFIQPILFLGCVLSIFAMTVPKPVIVYLLKKKDKRKQFGSDNTDDYYQQFNSDANDFIIDEQRDEMGLQNNASYDYYSDAHEAFEMNNYSDDVSTPLIDIPDVTKPYGAYSKRAKVMSFFEMGRKSQHIFREEDWIRVKDDPEDEEGNDLLEIVIFNSIQAMEYILGCISNTASYLRLWALSLAHAQLSTVFLEFVFYTTLEMKNLLLIFIGFAVFALSTLLILIGMESLSAFLHTLRLHWIEFQNKFYLGDGIPFSPFSFS